MGTIVAATVVVAIIYALGPFSALLTAVGPQNEFGNLWQLVPCLRKHSDNEENKLQKQRSKYGLYNQKTLNMLNKGISTKDLNFDMVTPTVNKYKQADPDELEMKNIKKESNRKSFDNAFEEAEG